MRMNKSSNQAIFELPEGKTASSAYVMQDDGAD